MQNPLTVRDRLVDRLLVTSDALRAKPHPDQEKLGDGLQHSLPQEARILPRL